jgi:hypothetical protein
MRGVSCAAALACAGRLPSVCSPYAVWRPLVRTSYRASAGGMHFHRTLTRVSVGGVDVTDSVNVTMLDDEPLRVARRRLQVGAHPYPPPQPRACGAEQHIAAVRLPTRL